MAEAPAARSMAAVWVNPPRSANRLAGFAEHSPTPESGGTLTARASPCHAAMGK